MNPNAEVIIWMAALSWIAILLVFRAVILLVT